MPTPPARPPLPRSIWVLGFVSLLMDVSSEMVHSLLPLYMVGSLGASVLMVGLIEGLGESTALMVKLFSGVWSDRLRRRKPLALAGYALGAISKPLFALAAGTGAVLAARLLDRFGKGIRGAPRDALVADIAPPEVRGAAFGLRQSLDTVGAFLGPLLAAGLMLLWANDFRAVFWVATIPAVLCVLLLALGLQEPDPGPAPPLPAGVAAGGDAWRRLGRPYRWVLAIGAAFMLARFSEAFLVLQAAQLGIPTALAPLIMVGMSAVYALSAYPFGALSDRLPRHHLLAAGLLVLIAADLVLAHARGPAGLLLGVALWGVHMGMTQGLLSALVAETAPADLRGTAFGGFSVVSGLALLLASLIAGALWDAAGAAATFQAGAALAALALLLLAAWRRALRLSAPRARS